MSFDYSNFSQQIYELSPLTVLGANTKFIASKNISGSDLFSSKSLSAIEINNDTVKKIESLSSFAPTGKWAFKGGIDLPQKTLNNALRAGLSTTLINCSILEKDFFDLLYKLSNDIYKNSHIPSTPGEIIFSTTLKNESMVKKRYGDYTSWEQIPGRFLLATTVVGKAGPASTQTFNKLLKSGVRGGEAKNLPAINEIPNHQHTFTPEDNVKTVEMEEEAGAEEIEGYFLKPRGDKSFEGSGTSNVGTGKQKQVSLPGELETESCYLYGNDGPAVTIKENTSPKNKEHNNMPPFYTVYIWKRTS